MRSPRSPRRRLALAGLVGLGLLATAAFAETGRDLPPGRDLGAGISLSVATPVGDVLAAPKRFTAAPILVRGRLSEVCQEKGCWTILRDGQRQLRVRFLDYAFFVPTDAVGRDALLEGTLEVVTLSEADARHYESETRGGDPDRVRGPVREVTLTASGVRLLEAD